MMVPGGTFMLGLVLASCAVASADDGSQFFSATVTGGTRPLRSNKKNPLEDIRVHKTKLQLDPAISLALNTTRIRFNGDWVLISWTGVVNPGYDDWVALYPTTGTDFGAVAPVKFKYADAAPTHMAQGVGALSFRVTNYRTDMRFAFLRGPLTAPAVVAVSTIIRLAAPNQPLQAHLALNGKPGEMVVQWNSKNAARPAVRWGRAPGRYTSTVPATSHTYQREDMCGGMAAGAGWLDPGQQHVARITGLTPGERVYYVYGDPVGGWSEERTLLTPPLPGCGTSPPSLTTLESLAQMEAEGPRLAAARAAMAAAATHGKAHAAKLASEADAEGSEAASEDSLRVGKGIGMGGGRVPRVFASGGEVGSEAPGEKRKHGHDRARTAMERSSSSAIVGPGSSVGPTAVTGRQDVLGGAAAGRARVCGVAASDDVSEGHGGGSVVRMLLAADIGQSEDDGADDITQSMVASLNTSRRLAQDAAEYSLLLTPGDLAYARGYQCTWDVFFNQWEPAASRMPWMFTPGNQERDWPNSGDRFNATPDSGGECGVVYEQRLSMPQPGRDQQWYSFDYGFVHFLMYSTEHLTAPGTPQYDFIARDLAAVDRSVTPWLVVCGHRPLYVSSTHNMPPDGDQDVAASLRADLEQLLVNHKVDLTFHGHHHAYQRACPMINGTCVGWDDAGRARGPVHLIVGTGGAGLTLEFQAPPPPWLEATAVWWGYMRIEAAADVMALELVSDLDGSRMDSLVLRK